jgi:diacylglycerol O-acyltransferase / wax synthase
VPLGGTTPERLSRVAASLRAARTDAGGPPVIGAPGMRLLAARGLYGIFLRRQRRFHTVVSNLRGPSRPLSLAGARIVDLIPFSVGEAGNVTLHVVALSYAGTLTVTVVADPDRVPDLPTLTAALQSELDRLAEPA